MLSTLTRYDVTTRRQIQQTSVCQVLVVIVEFLIYHFFCKLKLDTPENRGVLLLLEGLINGLRPTYYGFTSRGSAIVPTNVIPSPVPTNDSDSPQILTDIFQNRRSNGRKV
ncbi:hypothetical protein Bca4012_076912 [Brassica carinata]